MNISQKCRNYVIVRINIFCSLFCVFKIELNSTCKLKGKTKELWRFEVSRFNKQEFFEIMTSTIISFFDAMH